MSNVQWSPLYQGGDNLWIRILKQMPHFGTRQLRELISQVCFEFSKHVFIEVCLLMLLILKNDKYDRTGEAISSIVAFFHRSHRLAKADSDTYLSLYLYFVSLLKSPASHSLAPCLSVDECFEVKLQDKNVTSHPDGTVIWRLRTLKIIIKLVKYYKTRKRF